jgi:hypothetical protein
MYNSYYLIISTNGKVIIKQPTVGGWKRKIFEEIIVSFKEIRSIQN